MLSLEIDEVPPRPLLIMVGLTGTGKTTTVKALQQAGLGFLLLPNRRELTDRFIIQYLQKLAGEPVAPVTDRTERFAYTRRYRELHAGGMGDALFHFLRESEQLVVNSEQCLLFDGLRGENEVVRAAALFPQAVFLFLQAPDFVRVQRLLRRQDRFDAAATNGDGDTAVFQELAADILSGGQLDQLLAQVARGEINPETLQAKLAIVRSERQNYDPEATLAALQQLASARLIVADTTTSSPVEIAHQVIARLGQPEIEW